MKNDMNDWNEKPTLEDMLWFIIAVLVLGAILVTGLTLIIKNTDGDADMRYRNHDVKPKIVEAWTWE
jgi:hypothetical protein